MRRTILFIIVLSSFLTPYTLSSVNVALPSIGREFNVDTIVLNWFATAFLLSTAVFLVPFGRIADIVGRKRVYVVGLSVFAAASLLSGLAPSPTWLIVARFVQGLGGAMVFATGIAILTIVYPIEERGKVLGINIASVYAGLSVGPLLGGVLTQYLGWRSVFLFTVPFGFIIALMAWLWLRGEWVGARGESFDFIGSILYAVMLIVLLLGFSELTIYYLLLGIILFIFFVFWELRVNHPLIDVRIFSRSLTFSLSNLASLLNYTSTYSSTFLLSLYLQFIYGMSPQDAGLILLSRPVVQSVFSPFAGWLSDRVEPRVLASIGMGLIAVGLYLLSFIGLDTSIFYIISALVLIGFGFALFSSPNTNAIMSSIEKKFYGVASATLATMRVVGQTLSMAVVMLISGIYLGRELLTPATYILFINTMGSSFKVFVIICLIGLIASLFRGKIR